MKVVSPHATIGSEFLNGYCQWSLVVAPTVGYQHWLPDVVPTWFIGYLKMYQLDYCNEPYGYSWIWSIDRYIFNHILNHRQKIQCCNWLNHPWLQCFATNRLRGILLQAHAIQAHRDLAEALGHPLALGHPWGYQASWLPMVDDYQCKINVNHVKFVDEWWLHMATNG